MTNNYLTLPKKKKKTVNHKNLSQEIKLNLSLPQLFLNWFSKIPSRGDRKLEMKKNCK
jgi:hypothetical protein